MDTHSDYTCTSMCGDDAAGIVSLIDVLSDKSDAANVGNAYYARVPLNDGHRMTTKSR